MSTVAVRENGYIGRKPEKINLWDAFLDKFIAKFGVDEKSVPEYKNDGTYGFFTLTNDK